MDLPAFGNPTRPTIGQQFEFKVKMALLAQLPLFRLARRLVPGFCEVLVTATSPPTLREQNALARNGQIGELLTRVLIGDDRANRDEQYHVRAGMSRAVRSFAVAAAIRFEFAIITVTQQSVIVRIGFQINAAAIAAVAARGAAARHEFLTAERDAAVPAVPGLYVNFRFIGKRC